jgi:hypothetical protein
MKTAGVTRFLQPATTSNCVQEQRLVCCADAQARYVSTQPRDASQWFWHESKNELFSGDLASCIVDTLGSPKTRDEWRDLRMARSGEISEISPFISRLWRSKLTPWCIASLHVHVLLRGLCGGKVWPLWPSSPLHCLQKFILFFSTDGYGLTKNPPSVIRFSTYLKQWSYRGRMTDTDGSWETVIVTDGMGPTPPSVISGPYGMGGRYTPSVNGNVPHPHRVHWAR